jgi:23S rRNA (adenine2503-C2)-methyltransferase
MRLLRVLKVPTGHICVAQGAHGPLEFISVGDYGKEANLKADFLGLTDEIEYVPHQELMPLEEKWVITLSTQYGCRQDCLFCDVPKVGGGRNATLGDMQGQLLEGLQLHPEVEHTDRLNVHFARMGEPSWNPNVLDMAKWMHDHIMPEHHVHPVVSTMMPRNNEWLKTFVHTWMRIKNRVYNGGAGLQISINSTDPDEREWMFSGGALDLFDIHEVMDGAVPTGRKIALNFAVADYTIDADLLTKYFPPEFYLCKLTPMHQTSTAEENGIRTDDGYCSYYPYREYEENLKSAGYDVIVFLPSLAEDLGRITCGNAILSGTLPEVDYEELPVQ